MSNDIKKNVKTAEFMLGRVSVTDQLKQIKK
jgi:hypothetical protein